MSLARRLSLASLVAALMALPGLGQDSLRPAPAASNAETLELAESGKSTHGLGRGMVLTGAALLPLGALALVPVAFDGAFGITAADPGIGGGLLVLGLALMELGAPAMGMGADRLEAAAASRGAGFTPGENSGWAQYRQGWKMITIGSVLIVAAFPFAVIGGLDFEKENWVDYTGMALGAGGLGLGVAGILRHGQGLAIFHGRGRRAKKALAAPSVSLHPTLRLDRAGPPLGGLRLSVGF